MMNNYTERLTVFVPEKYTDIANNLAAVVGLSLADLNTFKTLLVEDADGDKYAVMSNLVTPGVMGKYGSALVRPAWDVDSVIDMDKAAQAQALIRFDYTDLKNSISVSTVDDFSEALVNADLSVIPMSI